VTSGGWVDVSEAEGGFCQGLDQLQLCPFFGGSVLIVLIGGSVALGVGGLTSCVRWLNGVDPVVEWCGIEVESVVRWVLLLCRSAVGASFSS